MNIYSSRKFYIMDLVHNMLYKKNRVSGMKACEAATEHSTWIVTTDYTDTALMHTLIHAHILQ